MAQRNSSRIDRFAQMSKQEEIIAKKRQEILEKQRTAELAKAVAAAQSLAAKLKSVGGEETPKTENVSNVEEEPKIEEEEDKKLDAAESPIIPNTTNTKTLTSLTSKTGKMYGSGLKRPTVSAPSLEQTPAKVQNTFCNDGSFLENFKKILEKQQQQQPKPLVTMTESTPTTTTEEEIANTSSNGPTATNAVNLDDLTSSTQAITEAMLTTQQQELQNQQQQLQQQHQQQQLQLQHHQIQQHQHQHQRQHQHHHQATLPPPPPTPPTLPFAFNPTLMAAQNLMLQQQMHAPSTQATAMPPHTAAAFFAATPQFVPPPPPPTTVAAAAAAAAAMLMPMQAVAVAPPPPPPPPQIPLALANLTPLYMIPAPEPMQLNAIPQPKEFDLNAIPKPQLNLEAIQIPVQNMHSLPPQQQPHQEQMANNSQQQQQLQDRQQREEQLTQAQLNVQQQPQTSATQQLFEPNQDVSLQQEQPQEQEKQQHNIDFQHQEQLQQSNEVVFSDNNPVDNTCCIQIPTSIENLIDLVAENGDAYEETLRGFKNQLHPALWFLSDKTSEQYHHYRQQIIDRRQEKLKEQQQKEKDELEMEKKTNPLAYKQRRLYCSIEEDKYDPESVISADNDSDDEYRRGMMDRNTDNIKRRIECRNELSEEERQEREAEEQEELRRMEKKKLRKSRWGGKIEMPESSSSSSVPSTFANQNKPLLSAITRTDPALLSYATLNYGSTNLSEEEWKKCEEHFKVNLLYQDMMRKRQEIDNLAKSGKFKYEYDSDEDVDGGTWEHKLRQAEMEATRIWALALTKQSEGKHHIGDFLPPEELKKFMEQYEAKKSNRQPDLSDYKEYKLKEDNIGFQMLQKLGWKEGQGLGQDGAGIVDPVNKGPQREGNQGLGVQNSATPEDCDNEYDAYRKRMMLAYRFRPNPLNNPRRAYY